MDNCIFCKIINGEIPAYKVWEDDKFLAILDIFPEAKGMTLVIPKEHIASYIIEIDENKVLDLHRAVKTIARILDTKLAGNIRTKIVYEGLDVPHLHAKLIPEYSEELKNSPKPIKATDEDLAKVLSTIKG